MNPKDLLGATIVDYEYYEPDDVLMKVTLEKNGKQFVMYPTDTGGIIFYEELK